MGNSTKKPQQFEIVSSYNNRHWHSVEQLTYCQIWQNTLLNFPAEVYTVQSNMSVEELNKYAFRNQNNKDIVGVYHVVYPESQFLCGRNDKMNILIQRIPIRLEKISDLTQQQALSVLLGAYSGYNTIGSHYGPVKPLENTIGFTQAGKTKVWVNYNFGLNNPWNNCNTTEGVQLQKMNRAYVREIYAMVQKKTLGGLQRLKSIFKAKQPTYFQAINIIEHYADIQGKRIVSCIRPRHSYNQLKSPNRESGILYGSAVNNITNIVPDIHSNSPNWKQTQIYQPLQHSKSHQKIDRFGAMTSANNASIVVNNYKMPTLQSRLAYESTHHYNQNASSTIKKIDRPSHISRSFAQQSHKLQPSSSSNISPMNSLKIVQNTEKPSQIFKTNLGTLTSQHSSHRANSIQISTPQNLKHYQQSPVPTIAYQQTLNAREAFSQSQPRTIQGKQSMPIYHQGPQQIPSFNYQSTPIEQKLQSNNEQQFSNKEQVRNQIGNQASKKIPHQTIKTVQQKSINEQKDIQKQRSQKQPLQQKQLTKQIKQKQFRNEQSQLEQNNAEQPQEQESKSKQILQEGKSSLKIKKFNQNSSSIIEDQQLGQLGTKSIEIIPEDKSNDINIQNQNSQYNKHDKLEDQAHSNQVVAVSKKQEEVYPHPLQKKQSVKETDLLIQQQPEIDRKDRKAYRQKRLNQMQIRENNRGSQQVEQAVYQSQALKKDQANDQIQRESDGYTQDKGENKNSSDNRNKEIGKSEYFKLQSKQQSRAEKANSGADDSHDKYTRQVKRLEKEEGMKAEESIKNPSDNIKAQAHKEEKLINGEKKSQTINQEYRNYEQERKGKPYRRLENKQQSEEIFQNQQNKQMIQSGNQQEQQEQVRQQEQTKNNLNSRSQQLGGSRVSNTHSAKQMSELDRQRQELQRQRAALQEIKQHKKQFWDAKQNQLVSQREQRIKQEKQRQEQRVKWEQEVKKKQEQYENQYEQEKKERQRNKQKQREQRERRILQQNKYMRQEQERRIAGGKNNQRDQKQQNMQVPQEQQKTQFQQKKIEAKQNQMSSEQLNEQQDISIPQIRNLNLVLESNIQEKSQQNQHKNNNIDHQNHNQKIQSDLSQPINETISLQRDQVNHTSDLADNLQKSGSRKHQKIVVSPQQAEQIERKIRQKYRIRKGSRNYSHASSNKQYQQINKQQANSQFYKKPKKYDAAQALQQQTEYGRHNLMTFMPKDKQIHKVQDKKEINDALDVSQMQKNLVRFQESRVKNVAQSKHSSKVQQDSAATNNIYYNNAKYTKEGANQKYARNQDQYIKKQIKANDRHYQHKKERRPYENFGNTIDDKYQKYVSSRSRKESYESYGSERNRHSDNYYGTDSGILMNELLKEENNNKTKVKAPKYQQLRAMLPK